mgnify:CR=1 FL=1
MSCWLTMCDLIREGEWLTSGDVGTVRCWPRIAGAYGGVLHPNPTASPRQARTRIPEQLRLPHQIGCYAPISQVLVQLGDQPVDCGRGFFCRRIASGNLLKNDLGIFYRLRLT